MQMQLSETLKALKESDHALFSKIHQLYHHRVYTFVKKRSQSLFLAQEVTQLTFIRLWEIRQKLSEVYGIDIQLFKIAKSILIDEIRKANTQNLHIKKSTDAYLDFYEEEDRHHNKDTLQHIYLAFENLPPVRKKVFKLSRVKGYSYKEIASELSISTKTVENHISKAIKQIRFSVGSL